MRRLLSLMLVMVTLSVIPQTTNLSGWDRSRWGMSVEEVLTLYGASGAKSRADDPQEPNMTYVAMHSFSVVGESFSVGFQFDKTKGLVRVVLFPVAEDNREGRPPGKTSLFKKLDQALCAKYGAPKYTDDSRFKATRLWALGATTIELTSIGDFSEKYPSILSLKYESSAIASSNGL